MLSTLLDEVVQKGLDHLIAGPPVDLSVLEGLHGRFPVQAEDPLGLAVPHQDLGPQLQLLPPRLLMDLLSKNGYGKDRLQFVVREERREAVDRRELVGRGGHHKCPCAFEGVPS